MIDAPCMRDPLYFKPPNPEGLGEAWLRQIYQSVHDKKFSFLCSLTGRHRVGKSITACVFGHLLDPTFLPNFEERVVYHPEDFMTAIEKIRKKRIIGGCVVLDEANIGMPSREWYNVLNKSVNYVLQAFGYMRPIVFFVSQDVSFVDSQARKLWHAFLEVQRKGNDFSTVLPFDIKFNKRTGKMYYIYPRFSGGYKGGRGTKITMNRIRVMKPPKDFIKRYDNHSQQMKDKLIEQVHDMIHTLKSKESGASTERYSEEEIIQKLLDERDNPVFVNRNGDYRPDIVARQFKIPLTFSKLVCIKANIKKQEMDQEEIAG